MGSWGGGGGRAAGQWSSGGSCGIAGLHTNLYATTKLHKYVN